jgi:hypothetical protein
LDSEERVVERRKTEEPVVTSNGRVKVWGPGCQEGVGGQARPEKVAYRQKRGGGCTKKEWSHEKDHDGRGHVRKMISR